MSTYELTPDGLVREGGRAADEVPHLDLGPLSPQLLGDLAGPDGQAARQFVRVGQVPAATYLTGRAPNQ
jgi:hypothetical protein